MSFVTNTTTHDAWDFKNINDDAKLKLTSILGNDNDDADINLNI